MIEDERWQDLAIRFTNLPQSAVVTAHITTDPREIVDMDNTELLGMLATWITEYGQVVSTMKTSAASMAGELAELRNQKAAIRSFLGTTDQPGDS